MQKKPKHRSELSTTHFDHLRNRLTHITETGEVWGLVNNQWHHFIHIKPDSYKGRFEHIYTYWRNQREQ